MLGCGRASCQRLPLENGDKIFNTLLYVCMYTPTYFRRDDGMLYKEGACSDSACPDSTTCFPYRGQADITGGVTGSYCGEITLNSYTSTNAISYRTKALIRMIGSVQGSETNNSLIMRRHSLFDAWPNSSNPTSEAIISKFDPFENSVSSPISQYLVITIISKHAYVSRCILLFLASGIGEANPIVPEGPTVPVVTRGKWSIITTSSS